ncbi:MAG: hypothetical protein J6Q94_06385 [Clostridia bacterium]|nr:hypothetical protein [Clostridia bacterium]
MPSDYVFRKAAFGGFNREDVITYISTLLGEISSYKNTIETANKLNEELTAKLNESEARYNSLQQEYEKQIEILCKSHNQETESIKQEYEEKLQNSVLADRSAEERVGTAMFDVRRYADLLIHETCEKIEKMSDDADAATAKTLSRVLDISSGIQAFSDKLNGILKDILMENEDLCKELTGFKGTLRLPYEEASGKIMADILED